jgi:hypothetical protein
MLNQLDEVASPHPPHILKRMSPLIRYYGDLSKENNFQQLTNDVCRLVELNPVPWVNVILDRAKVMSRCREKSLVALHSAIYDICAESWGALTWCCKSMENVEFVDSIENYFNLPRYIYLYRDGRDVALSFRKAVVGEKHMYNIALSWAKTQMIALNLGEKIDSSRFFAISYEELTSNAEEVAKRLCKFLDLTYSDKMFEFHSSDEAKRTAASSMLWSGLNKPITKNNVQKFLHEASKDDIIIFESIAGHVLDCLGYERAYIRTGEEKVFSSAEIERFNMHNEQLKQELLSNVDQNDMNRRDRQTSHLSEIKSRYQNHSYNYA